jgi:hypothetical protein
MLIVHSAPTPLKVGWERLDFESPSGGGRRGPVNEVFLVADRLLLIANAVESVIECSCRTE